MSRKGILWIIVILLVLAAAGGAYYYYTNIYAQAQEPVEEPTITTAQVSRGDLVITASGSGTLVPSSEVAQGFRSGGVLAEVLVAVGDRVEAGQLLARLDDSDAQDQIAQAEISVQQAELDLVELDDEVDPVDVAAAESSLSSAKADLTKLTEPPDGQDVLAAQQSLKSAREALNDLLALPDPDQVEIAKADMTVAEMNLRTAQAAYDKVAWKPNVGSSQEAADLWKATTDHDRAQAEYNEALEGASADEISDARAQIALTQAQLDALDVEPDPDELAAAEAKVVQARAALDNLFVGPSAKDQQTAELNVAQAQLNLESAQRALEDTVLLASAPGTVTAVEAQTGESVGTTAIITLADLDEPQVLFWVEEADLASVAPGNRIDVVFEALPDYTFPGEILSIDPVLVEVDGTPAVQVYASIDLSAHPINLLSGMNAEVEVVAGEARNVVLVPIQALRELVPGQFAVFVVLPNGELEMRVVGVGLRDFVNAEILSGLEPGDVVSTGTETNSETSSEVPAGGQQPPAGGGFMRFLGGQ